MIGLIALNMIGWIISSSINAGGGLAVTYTTANVSASSAVISVGSTIDFLSADSLSPAYIAVGDEIVKYEGKSGTAFTSCVRGSADPQSGKNTDARAHTVGTKVRTLDVQAVDSFIGYNIVTSSQSFGFLDGMWFLARFLWNLPKMLTWDFVFLRGVMVYARYLLMAVSTGITIGFIIAIRKG
jgi:hypothetical protein